MIKMLQSSGFEHIYEFSGKIEHEDFVQTDTKHKRRAVFLAAWVDLVVSGFCLHLNAQHPYLIFQWKHLENK